MKLESILCLIVILFSIYYLINAIKEVIKGLKFRKDVKFSYLENNEKYDKIIVESVISRDDLTDDEFVRKVIHNNYNRAHVKFLKSRNEILYNKKIRDVNVNLIKNLTLTVLSLSCLSLSIILLITYLK